MHQIAQPGTIPHRVIEWFKQQPEGTEVAAAVIAEALGLDSTNSFSTWMGPVRTAGLLRARTKPTHGRTLFWSLGDGTPAPKVPAAVAEFDAKVDAAAEPAKRAEKPSPPVVDDPLEFDACMWGITGDLIVYGAQETEDGGFLLTPKQQAVIKRLITWTPPA